MAENIVNFYHYLGYVYVYVILPVYGQGEITHHLSDIHIMAFYFRSRSRKLITGI